MRPLVATSWRRCLDTGLDPEALRAPVELNDADLADWHDARPPAAVTPVVRR